MYFVFLTFTLLYLPADLQIEVLHIYGSLSLLSIVYAFLKSLCKPLCTSSALIGYLSDRVKSLPCPLLRFPLVFFLLLTSPTRIPEVSNCCLSFIPD